MLSTDIVYRPTYQKLITHFTDYQHEQICSILKNSSTPGSAYLQLLELFQSLIVESMGFDDPMALAHLVYEYKEKFFRTKLIRDMKAKGYNIPIPPVSKAKAIDKPLIEKRKQKKIKILSRTETKEEKLERQLKNALICTWPTAEEKIATNLALFSKNLKNPMNPRRANNPEELKTEVRRCYLEVEQENPSLSTNEILQLTCQRVQNLGLLSNCQVADIINIITNN